MFGTNRYGQVVEFIERRAMHPLFGFFAKERSSALHTLAQPAYQPTGQIHLNNLEQAIVGITGDVASRPLVTSVRQQGYPVRAPTLAVVSAETHAPRTNRADEEADDLIRDTTRRHTTCGHGRITFRRSFTETMESQHGVRLEKSCQRHGRTDDLHTLQALVSDLFEHHSLYDDPDGAALIDVIQSAVSLYLGFVMTSDIERMAVFADIVRQLPVCVPVGEALDRNGNTIPHHYLVCAA